LLLGRAVDYFSMRENILIVDDEVDICFLLAGMLRTRSHQAVFAHTLSDGFEKLKQVTPTILFLDINLPDGNGLEAIRQFKALNPSMKIIMISAYDGGTERAKAESEGATAFISKPFTPAIIYSTLERISSVSA
jgi:two-component system, OmpR family, response regulator